VKKFISIAALFGAVLLAAGLAAPAAEASTVTATWTGTIRNGFDYGNSFGGFNDNDPVTLVTVFDTSTGTLAGNTITGGGTGTLTINGNSHVFSLSPSEYGYNSFGSLVMTMGDPAGYKLTAGFFSAAFPGSILSVFDGDCFGPTYCSGEFQIVPGWTTGNIDFSHLTVSVATTPIPAALPLFASALAGLGFMARRRKATTAA
jgi:hypothetical protein